MKSDRSLRRVLARNVRRLRELRGWPVEILARRLRLAVPRIAAIERGASSNVRIGVVEAIARVFDVEVAELLTLTGQRKKAPTGRRARQTRVNIPEDRPPRRRAS